MRAYTATSHGQQHINVHRKHKVPALGQAHAAGQMLTWSCTWRRVLLRCTGMVVTQQTANCVLNVLVKLSDMTEGVKDGARGGTGQKRERKEESWWDFPLLLFRVLAQAPWLVPGLQSSVPPFTHSSTGTAQKKDSTHCCHWLPAQTGMHTEHSSPDPALQSALLKAADVQVRSDSSAPDNIILRNPLRKTKLLRQTRRRTQGKTNQQQQNPRTLLLESGGWKDLFLLNGLWMSMLQRPDSCISSKGAESTTSSPCTAPLNWKICGGSPPKMNAFCLGCSSTTHIVLAMIHDVHVATIRVWHRKASPFALFSWRNTELLYHSQQSSSNQYTNGSKQRNQQHLTCKLLHDN